MTNLWHGNLTDNHCKQKPSVVLPEWQKRFPTILHDLFTLEVHSGIPGACHCGVPAQYRCCECHQPPARCGECLMKDHLHLPLHRVEEWTGTHFERRELAALGFVTHLGHSGAPCPEGPPPAQSLPPTRMVVTHTNGTHEIRISWCHCLDSGDHASQLLRAGLFPATLQYPASAFTVALLKAYHIYSLTSKTSAMDYIRGLMCLRDNAFPEDAFVRHYSNRAS